MFIPKEFQVTDLAEAFRFIEANSFGQLISNCEGRLFATHIPFLLSKDQTRLTGHIARLNPQGGDIDGQEVLVTLQGAHDYISPSWYVGPGVPTWNYQAVHIYGLCKLFNDPSAIEEVVDNLTNKYESSLPDPWKPEYNPSMLGAIVGVEITITDIQCKYKLSQNRSAEDRQQVIKQLVKNGSDQLAEAMQCNESS
ncbi:MAG: FMN-binding negative transcriptional regulator [Immundisolibacteraceae bacterium]|nr:FMN-binding negative transcriptional regulator [Immundisolibacteraceae bacterium]